MCQEISDTKCQRCHLTCHNLKTFFQVGEILLSRGVLVSISILWPLFARLWNQTTLHRTCYVFVDGSKFHFGPLPPPKLSKWAVNGQNSKPNSHNQTVHMLQTVVTLPSMCLTNPRWQMDTISIFISKCIHLHTVLWWAALSMHHTIKVRKRHYPPHLRHVATLPWEIKNLNFLQIFSRWNFVMLAASTLSGLPVRV